LERTTNCKYCDKIFEISSRWGIKTGTGKYTKLSQQAGFCSMRCNFRALSYRPFTIAHILLGIGLIIFLIFGKSWDVYTSVDPLYAGALLSMIIGLIGSFVAIPVFIAKITEDKSQREINKKYFLKRKMMEKNE